MTRLERGARGCLGGHVPKFGTRSIMVSSMRGNDVGDIVDGNVASKVEDVGDNSGMKCEGEVSGGGVEYTNGMKVWEGGVENLCCDAPKPGVSIDYPSTCEKSIRLVSRDTYLSKNGHLGP